MAYGKFSLRRSLSAFAGAACVLVASGCATRAYNAAPKELAAASSARAWQPGADVTDRFNAFLSTPALAPALPVGARILLVPGLSSKQFQQAANVTIRATERGRERNLDYFENVIDACAEFKWTCERVEIDTTATIEVNAQNLASIFRDQKTPYLVVGHSRGGVDALRALTSLPASERTNLRGVVTLQSPHGGIPTAATLEQMTKMFQAVFRTFTAVNSELTPSASVERMNERRAALDALRADVPLLTVGTWFVSERGRNAESDEAGATTSVLGPLEGLTRGQLKGVNKKRGLPYYTGRNDGVVSVEDTWLPEVRQVTVAGQDHVSPVFRYWGAPELDSLAFLRAVVGTLLAP